MNWQPSPSRMAQAPFTCRALRQGSSHDTFRDWDLFAMISVGGCPLFASVIVEVSQQSITGFILVGGASRRMGYDKGKLLLSGKSFVEHIAGALSPIVTSVSVVGNEFKGCEIRIDSVPDLYQKWGALGGVHAALEACQTAWAAVVACDLPFISTDLFRMLADRRGAFDAVAPIQNDGIPQPLCALYKKSGCLGRATQLIDSGERRPIALLQSVRTCWVEFSEIANLEGSCNFFDNINTQEDYKSAREKGAVIRSRD